MSEYLNVRYRLELVEEMSTVTQYEYKLDTAEAIHKFITEVCRLERYPNEVVITIACSASGKPTGWNITSIGDLFSSLVHPREVYKFAISANAAAIIIAHNHPSGDATPTEQDEQTAIRMKAVGELVGINLLDVVVVSNSGMESLNQMGVV